MKRLIILATLLCLATKPTQAQQSEYGDMTDAQVKAIQMTSLAMLAGNCASFHVIENALSEEWHDANISMDAPKFKNAMTLASLSPLEQLRKDPVEFCRGARQLLGPNGLYRRQMLEAN